MVLATEIGPEKVDVPLTSNADAGTRVPMPTLLFVLSR